MTTTLDNKIAILADLWLNYKTDSDFDDFISYNDLGLPLAYSINEGIVDKKDLAVSLIEETFSLLLAGLEVSDEVEYQSLEHILDEAGDNFSQQE